MGGKPTSKSIISSTKRSQNITRFESKSPINKIVIIVKGTLRNCFFTFLSTLSSCEIVKLYLC